jgi:hypothetical protein
MDARLVTEQALPITPVSTLQTDESRACDFRTQYLKPFVKGPFPTQARFATWPRDLDRSLEAGAKAIVEECRELFASRLAKAPVGVARGDLRSVYLWGLLRISTYENGRKFDARWTEEGTDTIAPLIWANLRRPISTLRWVDAFEPLLEAAYRARGWRFHRPESVDRWIRLSLSSTFRRSIDFRAFRRSVLEFLSLDRLTLSIANRMFPDDAILSELFNWVARNSQTLALPAIERPRLLPFLWILSHESAKYSGGDPIEAAERIYTEAGIERAAFRKLETWGWEGFSAARSHAEFTDCKETIAKLANSLHRLGIRGEPPELFMQIAGADLDGAWANRRRLEADAPLPDWYLLALYDECFDDDAAVRLIDGHELQRSRNWLREMRPSPDANQRRAGWSWIAAQSASDEFECEDGVRSTWPVHCADHEDGIHRVVAIRDLAALRQEAAAMKNCLARFHLACAEGMAVVFSIRVAETGERVACMSAIRRVDVKGAECWTLGQLAGRRNTRVDGLQPLAERVVRRLGAQGNPLDWKIRKARFDLLTPPLPHRGLDARGQTSSPSRGPDPRAFLGLATRGPGLAGRSGMHAQQRARDVDSQPEIRELALVHLVAARDHRAGDQAERLLEAVHPAAHGVVAALDASVTAPAGVD